MLLSTILVILSCCGCGLAFDYGGYQPWQPAPYDTYRYSNTYYNEAYDEPASPYWSNDQQMYPSYAAAYQAGTKLLSNQAARADLKSGYGAGASHSGGHQRGGYTQTKYVPVVKKTSKKKQKIISIDKGLFIPGGTQAFGKFKDLKSCMKACGVSPDCFAGDYNPWLGKCYVHGNITACNTMSAHSKLTHFKKVPCAVPGAPRSRLVLGAQLFGGIIQKGTKSLTDCLKKCVNAGGGIAAAPTVLNDPNQGGQICFGIDYDFSTHKCYFHTVNRRRFQGPQPRQFNLCPQVQTNNAFADLHTAIDLAPNPSVVHIVVCPPR